MPASIDPVFVAQADALREEADNISSAFAGFKQRHWMLGDLELGWDGSLFDIPGLADAYNRENLNTEYAVFLTPEDVGTVADMMGLKTQVDWLAAEERAMRIRHSTSIRASFHSAARRQGQSSPLGVFGQGLIGYVQNLIQQGS
jgi:hypothetical protein